MKSLLRAALPISIGVTLLATSPTIALRPSLLIDAQDADAQITQLNAQLLEQAQFDHRQLDDAMAAEFLLGYLDSLDPSHELFLQGDVTEFGRSLPNLAEATRRAGDTRLARAIFDRYLQRCAERADFIERYLAEGTFDFSGTDRYVIDRGDAPYPRDASAARDLWRDRLRADFLQEKLADRDPDEIRETLARRYRRQAETMQNLSDDAVLEIYINALAHVYDPHSDYMSRQQMENFNISMKLSLAGIGAQIQADGDYNKIAGLVPGGPAERGGDLKAGDRIVAVAQGTDGEEIDVCNLPLAQTVELVRGPKGTDVTLTVIPSGESEDSRKRITIRRDEIHFEDQEATARIVDLPTGGSTIRLGVIDLPAFYADEQGRGQSASADVATLIRKLKREDVRGIILDLRRNGGGSMQEAIDLTGLFIPSGAVVQTRDLSGRKWVGADEDGHTLYDGPLVVLTSRYSASASEIVAGALQDYGRALVVGDSSTFGKGTVQTIVPLGQIMLENGIRPEADPGSLKVTISKFYRPAGASTQLRGVRPDIVLPSFTDDPEISEAGMDNAMEWDAVRPAYFPRYRLVDRFLPELEERSRERIASGDDFVGWLEDLTMVEKIRSTRSISLNEAERLGERERAKRREEARSTARSARAKSLPPVYKITLKDTVEPGLPAAMKTDADTPNTDLLLEETHRILADYVRLLEPPAPDTQITDRR